MSHTICLLDTSVLCEFFAVPNKCARTEEVRARIEGYTQAGYSLIIPFAAILETGNHIAQCADGTLRRKCSIFFAKTITKALRGELPFTPTPFPNPLEVADWLAHFPEHAVRGVGVGDLSIIKVWERLCEQNPARRVFIWSYDRHLQSYDRLPP